MHPATESLRFARAMVIALPIALGACGGGSNPGGGGESGADGGSEGDGGSGEGGGESEDRISQVLVQITEQRITDPAFQNGSAFTYALPFLSPGVESCAEKTLFDEQGCRVIETVQPSCEPACADDEVCFADPDEDCRTECRPICTRECPEGEQCHLDDEGEMSCEPIGRFDGAGTVTVDGLTQEVVLPGGSGSVTFTDAVYTSSAVEASATGTETGVGLDAFELSLMPPGGPVASPPLAELDAADFADDLTVSWGAGDDLIELQLFGGTTHIDCRADDRAGTFTIPGGALSLIPGDAAAIRIDLRRVREEIETGISTSGSYQGAELPDEAEAILRLIRLETATIPL